jgi:hypothetical protein
MLSSVGYAVGHRGFVFLQAKNEYFPDFPTSWFWFIFPCLIDLVKTSSITMDRIDKTVSTF